MITEKGPQLLEYNCRFGDPETQVILPLIDGDLGKIFYDLSIGNLNLVKQKNIFASCVVMAAPGYPMHPEKNISIKGDISYSTDSSYFLHAGTKKDHQGHWVTQGGRVLNSLGIGSSLKESLDKAYMQSEKISWMGLQKRSDIGKNRI
jgi:phosphoribosylamine--glycine ligase